MEKHNNSSYDFIESQLRDSLLAIKRLREKEARIGRQMLDESSDDMVNEELNKDILICNLQKVKSKMNQDINHDIKTLGNLKSNYIVKDALIDKLNKVKRKQNEDIDEDIHYITGFKHEDLDFSFKKKRRRQIQVVDAFTDIKQRKRSKKIYKKDPNFEIPKTRERFDSYEDKLNRLKELKGRMKKYVTSFRFIKRKEKAKPEYIYSESKSRSSSDESIEKYNITFDKISEKIDTLNSIYEICQKVNDVVKA